MADQRQLTLLFGDEFDLPPGGPDGIALGTNDPLPPGPYRLGLLYDFDTENYGPPFSVVAGNGRAVAAHIPSLAIAQAVRDALNERYPSHA